MNRISLHLILFCLIAGCASGGAKLPITTTYRSGITSEKNVIIGIFKDTRTQHERLGVLHVPGFDSYSDDNDFGPDISGQISRILKKHLEKARIFKSVEVRTINKNLVQNFKKLEELSKEGVDLVILGNLSHFYGSVSTNDSMWRGSSWKGASLTTDTSTDNFVTDDKKIGGQAEYTNLKVIDVKNKKIIWTGDVSYRLYQDNVKFPFFPRQYALQTLDLLNAKFTKKLLQALNNL